MKQNNDLDAYEVESVTGNNFSKENTKKQIILNHLAEVIRNGSKEMSGGGVNQRFINGEVIEIYTPNQREIYINSVKMLWAVVRADYNKKKKLFEKDIEIIEKKIKGLDEKYKLIFNKKFNEIYSLFRGRNHNEILKLSNYHKARISNEVLNMRQHEEVELYRDLVLVISNLLDSIGYYNEVGNTI